MSKQDGELRNAYKEALERVDDLTPFIELVEELVAMADQGRVNNMRRRLVVFTDDLIRSRERAAEKRAIARHVGMQKVTAYIPIEEHELQKGEV